MNFTYCEQMAGIWINSSNIYQAKIEGYFVSTFLQAPQMQKTEDFFGGGPPFLACDFCWHINRLQGSLCCQPEQCILKGKSIKITIHVQCLITLNWVHLLTPDINHGIVCRCTIAYIEL